MCPCKALCYLLCGSFPTSLQLILATSLRLQVAQHCPGPIALWQPLQGSPVLQLELTH